MVGFGHRLMCWACIDLPAIQVFGILLFAVILVAAYHDR